MGHPLGPAFRPADDGVRQRLSEAHGTVSEVTGQAVAAFPTPSQVLEGRSFPGLDRTKVERLHAVALAALYGRLDADHLRVIGPDAAVAELQELPGIDPFYAALVVVRGTGFADVLATDETRLLATVGDLYELGHPTTATELTEGWRPLSTWASVLVRAAHHRLV